MIAARIADALHGTNRAFIDCTIATVYVRCAARFFDGEPFMTLDIANVEVHERYRQHGIFSVLVEECERAALMLGRQGVFVENVLNPIVFEALKRRGYLHVADRAPDVCMFKRLNSRDIGE
ncbi:hypothetical protein [Burkholderia sp. LMG 21824]|uniref:hypothetical protein n=1 Tax=Burkholderia sp. LMG 21824 TaxID=3158172 RepID=UPI003C2EACC6